MPLTTSITVSLAPVLTSAASILSGTPRFAPSVASNVTWADGTGADQANVLWSAENRSISATTNDDLDLAGALTDALGSSVAMARIRAIYIKNRQTAAGQNIEVGGAATNCLTTLFGDTSDKLLLRPKAELLLFCGDSTGYAVTAGSADVLRIRNPNGVSVAYDIAIIGANA